MSATKTYAMFGAGPIEQQELPARGDTVLTLTGNPRPHSRTARIAELAARAVAGRLAEGGRELDVVALDLAESTLDRDLARERLATATIAVVASPTYKATYTGLLKAFLDELPGGALAGVLAVPLMTAGDPRHALAADVHLRPLLLELGATCPTPALVVVGEAQDAPAGPIETWLSAAAPALQALTAGATR